MFVFPTPKPALLAAITILAEAFGQYAFVSAKMPRREYPERFLKVSRVGGGLQSIATDSARILVECYAKDVAQIEAMCNTARTALRNAAGTNVSTTDGPVFIRRFSNEQGPADYKDPDLLEYDRWQFFGDLTIKAN